jgi:hypothetical protein
LSNPLVGGSIFRLARWSLRQDGWSLSNTLLDDLDRLTSYAHLIEEDDAHAAISWDFGGSEGGKGDLVSGHV